jgi:hypothetical protein
MGALLLPLAYVAMATLIGFCGRSYRFGFWGYFFATLLLTPLIGILLLIAVGNPSRPANRP